VSSTGPNRGTSPTPDSFRRNLAVALPAAAALAYALGHLDWYLGTPLGRVPVLDERENLDLAAAIAGGSLPAVPFYRAPGYALVLACIRWMGVSAAGLFPAALLLGAVLHAVNAALVAKIARRWFGDRAALIGGLLFGLDPVMVHYATQALDSTLSLTFFLAGLVFLAAALAEPDKAGRWAAAGISWAAATLVRPNFLLAWIVVPALALFREGSAATRTRIVGASLAGIVLFGAASAWQWTISGVPGFLPWQGAYNLWAANRPGANGRYYTQHVSIPPEAARANPARAESILLYEQETGGRPPDIALMNAHWRMRFLDELSSHPVRWAGLMARKAYALLNNWEQYNNKTFAFHKARSPWLSWNPVCWGILFVLGVAGAFRLAIEAPRTATALAIVWLACAASIVLFFVSARFRLPLAAMCAVLAGGALGAPLFWRGWTMARRTALACSLALAGLVAFSDLGDVSDPSTFVQDHVLLARAAYTVGDDATAYVEAEAALKMQPWHPDALVIVDAVKADSARMAPSR
jgi:4-amino-4-deoxy-L-arabinose transferase-like glycosyltransferase